MCIRDRHSLCEKWHNTDGIRKDGTGYSKGKDNGCDGVYLSLIHISGYSTGDVTDRLLDKLDSLEKENDGLHTLSLIHI